MQLRPLLITVPLLMSSCVPSYMQRFEREPTSHPLSERAMPASPPSQAIPAQPAIVPIEDRVLRLRLSFEQVWDAALSVIIRDYNISIVDRDSGVITTEWDSFYVKSQPYRNKLSIRIKGLARGLVELRLHNSVETLKTRGGVEGPVWLPAGEGPEEIGRIVHNLALFLKQEPPNLKTADSVSEHQDETQIRQIR